MRLPIVRRYRPSCPFARQQPALHRAIASLNASPPPSGRRSFIDSTRSRAVLDQDAWLERSRGDQVTATHSLPSSRDSNRRVAARSMSRSAEPRGRAIGSLPSLATAQPPHCPLDPRFPTQAPRRDCTSQSGGDRRGRRFCRVARFGAGVAIVLATLILIAAGAQLDLPSLAYRFSSSSGCLRCSFRCFSCWSSRRSDK